MLDCQVKSATPPHRNTPSVAKSVALVSSTVAVSEVVVDIPPVAAASATVVVVGAAADTNSNTVVATPLGRQPSSGRSGHAHHSSHSHHRTSKSGATKNGVSTTAANSAKLDHSQCTYCRGLCEPGQSHQPTYWEIQLDPDLLETLLAIYPEWFKDYDLDGSHASPGNMADGAGPHQGFVPRSPPKAEVDETPIHRSLDKHKESLKVKLLLRRPINQLVDQGIMPPLKTPPGFHEQRQKLERAKMGDILKSKIQRRPDRQELIQQHILEDSNVDPSLQDKQRQLKKARLADDLNERLSHRPGPLELIKGNILKADEFFAQALKDGQIPFKRTCEGESRKHPPPPFVFEEDSSSEGALSPLQESELSQCGSTSARSPPDHLATSSSLTPAPTSHHSSAASAAAISVASNQHHHHHQHHNSHLLLSSASSSAPSPSLCSAVSTLSPLSSIASPAGSLAPVSPMTAAMAPSAAPAPLPPQQQVQQPIAIVSSSSVSASPSASSSPASRAPSLHGGRNSDSPGRDPIRNRKKSKSKSTPKTRTIKFHEYKGPPNAQKSLLSSASQVETSYELLLQQQQLFLKWQLELQHKYPQIILPAAQKSQNMSMENGMNGIMPSSSPPSQSTSTQGGSCSQPSPPEVQPSRCLPRLEDMKVSDLKVELKKRNLPVSGSKPQLIERLRPALLNSALASSQPSPPSHEPLSWPGSLNLDSPPQLSPKEEILSVACSVHMDEPLSPPELFDHDSVESTGSDLGALASPYTNGLPSPYTNGLPSPYTNGMSSPYTNGLPSPYTTGVPTPLHRPPSVAPMDVDASTAVTNAAANNSNSGCFDPMDVSDIGRSLPQIPPAPPLPSPANSTPATVAVTSMASSLPIMTALLNHHEVEYHQATDLSPTNEDILRKKIEDLQRELQRSQMELQQHQTLLNTQFTQNVPSVSPQLQPTPPPAPPPQQPPAALTPAPSPAPAPVLQKVAIVTFPTAIARSPPPRMISLVKTENDHKKLNGSCAHGAAVAGNSQKTQQKQFLQQHLQQKIQQQQLLQLQQQKQAQQQQQMQQQQQQQVQEQQVGVSSTGSSSAKASLTAFLQNHSVSSSSTPPKVYYNINASVPVSSATMYTTTTVPQSDSTNSKQRANSLPGGLGHVSRTNSLPNFVSLTTLHQKQPIMRTVTDPQFIFAKPPPDYNEAVRHHNKQQFTHLTLFDTLNSPSGGRKSVKSQDVDDVLEILIKNGELPASAAQEPPTPPTPKSSLTASLLFPAPSTSTSSSSASSVINTTTLSSVDATILQVSTGVIGGVDDDHDTASATSSSPPHPSDIIHTNNNNNNNSNNNTNNVLDSMLGTPSGGCSNDDTISPLLDTSNAAISTASNNASGSVAAPPTFDLDLSLDLEGLEPMNLEGFGVVDVHHLKTESSDDFLEGDDDDDSITGGSLMSNHLPPPSHQQQQHHLHHHHHQDEQNIIHEQQHQQQQSQQQQHQPNVAEYVDFGDDECIHMDIDMTDVSDWLDSVLPCGSGGNGTDGNTMSGSAPPPPVGGGNHNHHQQLHQHHHHTTLNSVDCNDPLLSANQDIFNLLNLDDDYKAAPDLGSLTWDKLDYAT